MHKVMLVEEGLFLTWFWINKDDYKEYYALLLHIVSSIKNIKAKQF